MPNRMKEPHATKKLRKLESGRFQARVTYWDPETGKRRETTGTFATEREAKKWKTEQEMRFRQDPNQKPPTDKTVAVFFSEWLDIKATNCEPTTVTSYGYMAAHVIRELGQRPLKALTTLEIQQFYAGLTQRPLSTRTVQYVHTVLQMALTDAVQWGLLSTNPASKAKVRTRSAPAPLRIPTPEETSQLLRAAQNSRWYALWVWFVATGTRLGEALAVKWTDIDWDRGMVTVRWAMSGDAAKRRLKKPKNTRERTVKLGKRLLAVLRDHARAQEIEREAAGDSWQDTGRVFVTRQGKLLAKANVEKAFARALIHAGLPSSIRIHDLRHAMATRWLSAGKNPLLVSQRLGHTDVAFTLQKYGHVLPHEEAAVVDEMEAVIPPRPATHQPHEPSESLIFNERGMTLRKGESLLHNTLEESAAPRTLP